MNVVANDAVLWIERTLSGPLRWLVVSKSRISAGATPTAKGALDAGALGKILADSALQQDDPHFKDLLLFNEYFHGETGKGLGAAHQTGWTALIALLLHPREEIDPSHVTPASVVKTGTDQERSTS